MGIDIDSQAVAYLTNELQLNDIFCHDVTREPLPPEIADEPWDYLIAGEILEHIANPADFLQRLTQTLAGNVAALVLTVPNALKWGNYKNARRGWGVHKHRPPFSGSHRIRWPKWSATEV